MATGVNYWSSYEPGHEVSEGLWGGGREYSSEEGGGGVTGDAPTMEVKGQLISASELLTCPDRKQRERMVELQEKRRSLQTLLSTRLAELRGVCLQEAELTGAVPGDFPLEVGEKLPCVRRRGGTSVHGNGKTRVEEEESQRLKLKKTLFSVAVRKHNDSEYSHHGKRMVHRGCHTDDLVQSESSSTSDLTGHDYDDGGSQCRPPLVSAGSPDEVFYQNKTRKTRTEHLESLQNHVPLPLPSPHPPPRSQDSFGPTDPGLGGNRGGSTVCPSDSSDGLLDHTAPPEEVGGHHRGARICLGKTTTRGFWIETKSRVRVSEEGGAGRESGGGGYSEVLLDYVWGKQKQPGRLPVTLQHQPLYNGCSPQQLTGAPPTYRHHGNQRHVTVTRTKSCGPSLPIQQNEAHSPDHPPIQPDPHPHLLPPRPPQLPPYQDSQLEEATRSLHKALALEGLRDWYLRNTLGSSHQNQASQKVTSGSSTKTNGGVKGHAGGGGALQRRRTTHGLMKQSTYQTETSHHQATLHQKRILPHSATFHGHPLHDRSVDSAFYQDLFPSQKQEDLLRDLPLDQLSPGTLV
ncbi:FERM domain-containing protein 4B [Melanotaenia boesemani]|uniref:FERM domain-containing protein 4B n=1 Tax=Melanotaenia boesemani TaxID=1250792 RepID=UPI001C05706F|nr:FERM domain-containing protein 4B [Melanotaenia boesemani]XP_041858927.1 FERM domain-containing protein 4B [Melanotaenia boesemani]